MKEGLLNELKKSLDTTEKDREKIIKLYVNFKKSNLITGSVLHEILKSLINVLEERENEVNNITSAISVLLSNAISEQLMSLADIAGLLDNGTRYPLFLLILQNLHKLKGKTDLTELFNNNKINLLTHLPENDRTKERLAEILEERDLTFLYPLLRIQAELSKQLQEDPNPQVFYKWIKENLDPVNYTDSGFINALVTVLLKYITQVSIIRTNIVFMNFE